jgi:hypothetical protein
MRATTVTQLSWKAQTKLHYHAVPSHVSEYQMQNKLDKEAPGCSCCVARAQYTGLVAVLQARGAEGVSWLGLNHVTVTVTMCVWGWGGGGGGDVAR